MSYNYLQNFCPTLQVHDSILEYSSHEGVHRWWSHYHLKKSRWWRSYCGSIVGSPEQSKGQWKPPGWWRSWVRTSVFSLPLAFSQDNKGPRVLSRDFFILFLGLLIWSPVFRNGVSHFLVKYKTSLFRRKGYTDEHWTVTMVIKIYGSWTLVWSDRLLWLQPTGRNKG